MNKSQDIYNLVDKQALQNMKNSCLHLKAIIDIIQWIAFQACALKATIKVMVQKIKVILMNS